jgi:hypothetical protein
MLLSIENQGRKLNQSDIVNFENVIGHELPPDYKKFLLNYNGGEPKQNYHDVQGTEGKGIGDFVECRCFFAIDGPESYEPEVKKGYDIEWNYLVLRGRIPDNFLPISEDSGGNIVCLSLYGEDLGSIWFWSHHDEHYPPSYSNCYKVADSFQELLEGMFEYDFENDVRLPDVAD